MELRIPIVVDDVDWKRDQTQTTRGVERYIFDNGGIDFEIDLAPENAAILLKAIEKRDAELARIQAEYAEALTDYLVPARRTLGAPRKTIRGAKRAAPAAAYVAPANVPALTAPKAPRKGYLSIPDKAGKVACRAWAKNWADKMGWGTIGDYGVLATALVDAWTEVGSPADVNVPPKGLGESPAKPARKAGKAKPATLPFSEAE